MEIQKKIEILTEGAKFDVSCSSSGSNRGEKRGQLGSCSIAGLCHTFTQDGRCVSLFKILMSNNCSYDCLYCINRHSNNIERASLEPEEICNLTINFYRRNYIEGLFLSSAVENSPDKTMEKLILTVKLLRTKYNFRGYIHLKAIPGCDRNYIDLASKYVDRMSINLEFPNDNTLKLLAPQKKQQMLFAPMKQLSDIYQKNKIEKPKEKILPAGQTTQIIIGASKDSDSQIIRLSENLYQKINMKRVYYSAYIPTNTTSALLPMIPPDLRREHRLYEADWLLRFYGYKASELLNNGNFPLNIDVKSDWALRNFDKYPIEINTASYEMLLRVPGIGIKNAYRIIKARIYGKLSFENLQKMRVILKRAKYFITINGKFYGNFNDPYYIRNILVGKEDIIEEKEIQLSLFDND